MAPVTITSTGVDGWTKANTIATCRAGGSAEFPTVGPRCRHRPDAHRDTSRERREDRSHRQDEREAEEWRQLDAQAFPLRYDRDRIRS